MIRITHKMSPGLKSFFNQYPAKYENAKKKGIRDSLSTIERTSKIRARAKGWKSTGKLAQGIQSFPHVGKVVAGNNISYKYHRIQEFGGTIRAKNKPYLVFQVAKGVWRKAKQVRIPGKKYFFSSLDDNILKIRQIFLKEFGKVLHGK